MVKLVSKTTKGKFLEYSDYILHGGYKVSKEDKDALRSIISIFEGQKKGLMVIGNPGSGKTLIFEILQKITNPQAKESFAIMNVLNIVQDFNINGHECFNKWKDDNVLFDDLGTENKGVHYGDKVEVMEKFIQFRYEVFRSKKLLTHFTSNLNPSEIATRYGFRCKSRLTEMTEIVTLGKSDNYTDYRSQQTFDGHIKVYHPPILSKEDIEWRESYNRFRETERSRPRIQGNVPGLGERTKIKLDPLIKVREMWPTYTSEEKERAINNLESLNQNGELNKVIEELKSNQ